jgi:hypothetical protein
VNPPITPISPSGRCHKNVVEIGDKNVAEIDDKNVAEIGDKNVAEINDKNVGAVPKEGQPLSRIKKL